MNMLNRNNRNSTAMVQPKNNVINNTVQLSQPSQSNQSIISTQVLPLNDIPIQYNSCQNNGSSISAAKIYNNMPESMKVNAELIHQQTTNGLQLNGQQQPTRNIVNQQISYKDSLGGMSEHTNSENHINTINYSTQYKQSQHQHQNYQQINNYKTMKSQRSQNKLKASNDVEQKNRQSTNQSDNVASYSPDLAGSVKARGQQKEHSYRNKNHDSLNDKRQDSMPKEILMEDPTFTKQVYQTNTRRMEETYGGESHVTNKNGINPTTKHQIINKNGDRQAHNHQMIVNGFQSTKGLSSARGSMSGSMKAAPASIHRPKSNSGVATNGKLSVHDQLSLLKSKNSTSGTVKAMQSYGQGSNLAESRGSTHRKKNHQTTKNITYTTDQKMKSHINHQPIQSGGATPGNMNNGHSSHHGLNSMRNYSGTIHKAPVGSNSLQKNFREKGYNHPPTKMNARAGKVSQEHGSHNIKYSSKTFMSGTHASESTGLSKSGRSGEGDRPNIQNGVQSSISTSRLPLHPKQVKNNNNQTRLMNANSKSSVTNNQNYNQTPNTLNSSNSQNTLSKHKQFYSNNAESSQNVIKKRFNATGGPVFENESGFDVERGTVQDKIGSSSDNNISQKSNINQKIQKFDFRDYDSDEKLRIKRSDDFGLINSQFNLDENKNVQKQAENNEISSQEQTKFNLQQQNVLNGEGQQDFSKQDYATSSSMNPSQTYQSHSQQFINKQENSKNGTEQQKDLNSSQIVESSSKKLNQSKSTSKVNKTERPTTESNMTRDVKSNSFNGVFEIDDSKMKQFEQLIQTVKFQNDEIKALKSGNQTMPQDSSQYKENKSEAQRAYNYTGNQNKSQFNRLQIQIPEGSEEDDSKREQSIRESSRNENSIGQSSSLNCGEENLAPSTDKKKSNCKIGVQRVPKSGPGMMKTSTNLQSQLNNNKNIFSNKMPCNSTRNNTRYNSQILDEELNPLKSKTKSKKSQQDNGTPKNGQIESQTDLNQETPKIQYKERSSVASRILQQQVNFEMRSITNKITTSQEKLKKSSSGKKKNDSGKKNPSANQSLLHRGTSQGPPVKINRENRIASEVIVGSAQKSSKQKNKSTSLHDQIKPKDQQNTQPATTLSKCLGIRSGSENNVKTNHSILTADNTMKHGCGLNNLEYAMNDQRGLGIQPAHKIIIPNDDPTKTSNKRTGIVRSYAANTNQGLVRNYNEDRVSIITNLLPPKQRTDITPDKWPRCSYFGIYDGHGGSLCADFLRDNLHQFVIMEPCFPANPKEAIIIGFEKAERAFMEKIYNPKTKELKDKSGSCAIVVMIVQETCYVANVGDSRAVLSCEGGQKVYPLSLDHKPGEDCETKRIRKAGGQIYYRTTKNDIMHYDENKIDKLQQMNLAGPLRVLPGRLSVARTFGDPEAKIPELGGNPNVVIHNPDVKSFVIKKDHDFIVLGCDGIYDKMSNSDSIMCVWKAAYDNKYHQNVKGQAQDVHKLCGMGVEYILKNSLLRRSLDNVTVVVIGFSNLKHEVFGHQQQALQQIKSDGDSGTENQHKAQSQVFPASQQLQGQAKKQNIVQNNSHSYRERDGKSSQKYDQQENAKTIERNRSANLPRDSALRQSIQGKYQQITTQSNKKLEQVSKGSRKLSSTGHNSAQIQNEQLEKSQKKRERALTSNSYGNIKDKKYSPGTPTEAPNSVQIKKHHNLHQNTSTGYLHKNTLHTARPSHTGAQKDGAKPPLSNNMKYNNLTNHLVSQNITPTNSMSQKASSSQVLGIQFHQNQIKNNV